MTGVGLRQGLQQDVRAAIQQGVGIVDQQGREGLGRKAGDVAGLGRIADQHAHHLDAGVDQQARQGPAADNAASRDGDLQPTTRRHAARRRALGPDRRAVAVGMVADLDAQLTRFRQIEGVRLNQTAAPPRPSSTARPSGSSAPKPGTTTTS